MMHQRSTAAPSWWPQAVPFVVIGLVSVSAGGLVAAATAPVPSEHGSWAAAYLVLVCGLAQVGLGVGQAWLAPRLPSRRLVVAELAGWNVGNAAVMAGTLLNRPSLVDAGGATLAVTLMAFAWMSWRSRRTGWTAWAYRAAIIALLISVATGLALTYYPA